jgi:hypothetical protein
MKRIFQQSYRWTSGRIFSALTALALAGSAYATDPIFQNNSSLYFTVPGSPPPIYDVTAFDNENVFSVTYNSVASLYEPMNTYYYTNNGTMIFTGFGTQSGFRFDLQTTNVISRRMTGTIYNPGTIRVNSSLDGFGIGGQIYFEATNIINSGNLVVGGDGEINIKSKNADLSFGTLAIENSTRFSIANAFIGIGGNWNPQFSLGPVSAFSSTPNQFFAAPSKSYFQVFDPGTSNITVRAVFVANSNPNVPFNVYFGSTNNAIALIEWAGANQDPATCNPYTNYVYLLNQFDLVGSTNNTIQFSGLPSNFSIFQSGAPLLTGLPPAVQSFQNIFQPAANITPSNAYVNVLFQSTTVATNASGANPSGALTNLPGKIQITASNRLNLENVQLSGENYLSLTAPNHFEGSQYSTIIAPYSDINLGVTNGKLNIANLIASGVATVGGTMQAWSARWNYTDAGGTNYDFSVVIVSSQLTPQSPSWVQNLKLHATNSLVLNDVMNVFKSLSIDAQRLTLTTNACGNGFTSFDGELNWYNSITFGPTQIPNVLWLTNSGAIRALSDSIFGTAALRYSDFINHGLVADNGTTLWTTNFVNAGSITNGSGGFTMTSQRSVMTNGAVYANLNVSLTTSNLVIANETIFAGRSLYILSPNFLTDVPTNLPPNSVFSSNNWVVGAFANTGDGISLPVLPTRGDLLGTTITSIAPTNKSIVHLWPGQDRGYSLAGFSNNAALGHLVLDARGAAPLNGRYTFNGAGVSSAIYVDEIEFKNYSTNRDAGGNMQGITFNTNLVIYYAQAILNGSSIAEKLNLKNTNNGVNNLTSHFRWMPTYAGYFSSTNLINPDGTTNTVNKALAESSLIDSDGDGTPNNADPTPFFISSQINLQISVTNLPVRRARISWTTIPAATNTVWFKTNLLSPNWSVLTNFPSPQTYIPFAGADNYQAMRVVVLDGITNSARFYRIQVNPLLTNPNSF